jgi:transposase
MREFTFSPEVLEAICRDRYEYPHPRVQRKMEVLWLKSQKRTHREIAEIADVSPRSVQRFLDEFEQGGLELVRRNPWKGKACALDDHRQSLEDYFLENPPRSAREAQQAIERLTGIRRGLSQVRVFLKKKLGWAGGKSERFPPRRIRRNKQHSWRTSFVHG